MNIYRVFSWSNVPKSPSGEAMFVPTPCDNGLLLLRAAVVVSDVEGIQGTRKWRVRVDRIEIDQFVMVIADPVRGTNN